ncbi:hypothetical protein LX87_05599 [Larkinella arboricola]|uniref:Uncharacterized protein n=1 Tax=Larkinella arboricola TaxID=643671 RepID=A0A327WFC2_LARAB|nr:hypothetical protein [Larkinella arboricola]RAJ89910.1 hypothetical protein LX87_05599 [Larkinella arboricola]
MTPTDKFDSRLQKAFDFCSETSKQLINIAVGIIAFTITFAKDFIGEVGIEEKRIAFAAWILFFVSVLTGILTLSALASQLDPGGGELKSPSIWNKPISIFVNLQWIAFVLGLGLITYFGIKSLPNENNKKSINRYELIIPNSTISISPKQVNSTNNITNTKKESKPTAVTITQVPNN